VLPCRLPPAGRFYRLRQFDGVKYVEMDVAGSAWPSTGPLLPSSVFCLIQLENGSYRLEAKFSRKYQINSQDDTDRKLPNNFTETFFFKIFLANDYSFREPLPTIRSF
jgi:hypothetical protein